MPIRISLIDGIIPRIGIAVRPDGIGEPTDGAAADGGLGVDRIEVVRVDEEADDRVVPGGVEVDEPGIGVVALEGGRRACRRRRPCRWRPASCRRRRESFSSEVPRTSRQENATGSRASRWRWTIEAEAPVSSVTEAR